MNSKVVSFQIVQAQATASQSSWSPDVIALCEDGSLWLMGLAEFQQKSRYGTGDWKRMTPEPLKPMPILENRLYG